MQAAFAAGDRQRLITLTLPAYQVLAKQYGVAQAQFHLPPATSFLRLHQLDRFGDDLSSFRFTVLAANQQHQPIAGLEVGRGGLGVRGVVPVSYQDRAIGTVEFGLDPGLTALEKLKSQYGVDWQIMLSQEAAKIATFQPVTGTVEPPLSELVMQASTLAQPVFIPAETYQQVLTGNNAIYRGSFDDQNDVIYSTPLRDYSGQVIGIIDIIQDRSPAIQAMTSSVLLAVVALALFMGAGALGIAVLTTRIMRPIGELTATARAIEQGDLNRTAAVTSRDEIGTLGQAFNTMTGRLRELIDSLETRVEMRTAQVQASADVGRAATSILNTDQLLKQTATLITERFGFYYAGVFIVDEAGQWAVLHEASGPGDTAWVLKQSGHKLEIGGKSMVSDAIVKRTSQIALDVGAAPVRFANPLLPDARSEIALPLIVGSRVLGALDVQSIQSAAFDPTSAIVLQAMADQIAIALNNAVQYQREQTRAEQTTGLLAATLELSSQPDETKLFEHIEQVTSALLDADGVGLWFPVAEDWVELRHTINVGTVSLVGRQVHVGEGLAGKVYESGLALRVDDYQAWTEQSSAFEDAPFHSALSVPLRWQDRTLGVLAITRSQLNQPFTPEEENLAQLLAAQAAAALENIWLRAEQQRALSELDALNRRLTGEAWQAQALGQTLTYERRQTAAPAQTPQLSFQIPIELRGTAIGTVTLEDEQERTFTEDERALINGVTQQLALALENQRLNYIAQSAAQRDRAIAETADKIHQPTSLDALLRMAVDELSRITGIGSVGVQLGFAPDGPAGHNGHDTDTGRESSS